MKMHLQLNSKTLLGHRKWKASGENGGERVSYTRSSLGASNREKLDSSPRQPQPSVDTDVGFNEIKWRVCWKNLCYRNELASCWGCQSLDEWLKGLLSFWGRRPVTQISMNVLGTNRYVETWKRAGIKEIEDYCSIAQNVLYGFC